MPSDPEVMSSSDIEMDSKAGPSDVKVGENDEQMVDSSDDFSSGSFLAKTFKSTKHACPYPGCTMMFSKPFRLKTHIRIHTGDKPYACKEPGCSKAYTRFSHLKRHNANSHSKQKADTTKADDDSSDDEDDLPKVAQKFNCKLCPKEFVSKYSLERHEKDAHTENTKRYPCTTCGQTFAKKTWLNCHIASHNKELPHKCSKCGRQFVSRVKLNVHTLTHEHKCLTCQVTFNTFSDLRKHNSQEHNTKDRRTCPICQVEFKSRSQLRQHYVTHSDARDVYKCSFPMCPRTYLHERNLKQHIQAYHENNRFPCNYEGCEAKLATRGKLVLHMKVIHENEKKPKTKKHPKSHKKHPKKPIAALLTGAQLPREIEREIIVESRTFELSLPELSKEVEALKSDVETEAEIPKAEESSKEELDTEKDDLPNNCFLLPVRQIQMNQQLGTVISAPDSL